MATVEELEGLYQQVELVKGPGDPRTGRLCVMSFVAFLAGEGHSDRPATASPLIREFAVRVNDAMPTRMRQNLKPFVPRILGTNDGCDAMRSAALRRIAEKELLPRVSCDFSGLDQRWNWRRKEQLSELKAQLAQLLAAPEAEDDSYVQKKLAAFAAGFLCWCAGEGENPNVRSWYWMKAIDVLDRLCDIRASQAVPEPSETRIAELRQVLSRSGPAASARGLWGRAITSVSRTLAGSHNTN